MDPANRDPVLPPARLAALGAFVLALTVLLSNLASFDISPGEAIADRLRDTGIRRLAAIGYFAQLATGLWLALALLFDVPRHRRLAAALWIGAVTLYLAPLPPLTADLALVPASLTLAAGFAFLGRELLEQG